MTLFSSSVERLKAFGINSSDQQMNPFNRRSVLVFFLLGLLCLSSFLFLFYEANTVWEYTFSIYTIASVVEITICFTIVIFQMEKLFEFIDNCESFVSVCESDDDDDDSTLENSHGETSQQIEKWTKIIYITLAEISPVCLFLPQSIYCVIVYQTTDLGNEAFKLPLTLWYVQP